MTLLSYPPWIAIIVDSFDGINMSFLCLDVIISLTLSITLLKEILVNPSLEKTSPSDIEPHAKVSFAISLYDIQKNLLSRSPPLLPLLAFFFPSDIYNAIWKLCTGKAIDCEGLQVGFLNHGVDPFASPIVYLLDEIVCMGFLPFWPRHINPLQSKVVKYLRFE
jgi:hypothetical protein